MRKRVSGTSPWLLWFHLKLNTLSGRLLGMALQVRCLKRVFAADVTCDINPTLCWKLAAGREVYNIYIYIYMENIKNENNKS